ncbi:hypothetical protein AYI70_g7879 [Smittium culicis]|uniref:Uncharacterized protein n=1 Tax=Smittium culicis TaxID=133412 RepID=A0A1R1XIG2_9FUNG|nr:hypothetical protein AYI70_g7879 [Smittium culicis]
MVKFDQKACDTMFSAGIPELTPIAPIVPAFGIGVSAGLSMRVDKFLICLVIQSTDYVLHHSINLSIAGDMLIVGLKKDFISVSSIALKNSFMHGKFSIDFESTTKLNIADL